MKNLFMLIAAITIWPYWIAREIWLSHKMRSVERRSWR